jgi:hypothetical protein
MNFSISENEKESLLGSLKTANLKFQQTYPGDKPDRQPVHTVYGGANLFKSDTCIKMGDIAVKSLQAYAPDFVTLAKVLSFEGYAKLPVDEKKIQKLSKELSRMTEDKRKKHPAWLAYSVYNKVIQKLQTEPVEDFRIDFEDGFGNRPDEEEDATAVHAANELAKGMSNKTLSPFIGIRIKPFTEDLKNRGVRTLDIFLTTLFKKTNGRLPKNFVVMLPKVTIPEQVNALVRLFEILEKKNGLVSGTLKMETMVEATQIIMDNEGKNPLM